MRPNFATICDIGTGNGLFLNYLADQLPEVQRFVGIDLNKEQLLENKIAFEGTKLEFAHEEVFDWIVHRKSDDGIIFVLSETFQFFTQNELEDLLSFISNGPSPIAVAITEPIVDFDLSTEFASIPRGNLGFSHNYPYLFEKHHFCVFRKEIIPMDQDETHSEKYRVVMVAFTPPKWERSV